MSLAILNYAGPPSGCLFGLVLNTEQGIQWLDVVLWFVLFLWFVRRGQTFNNDCNQQIRHIIETNDLHSPAYLQFVLNCYDKTTECGPVNFGVAMVQTKSRMYWVLMAVCPLILGILKILK